jgi:ppGpp synthetase/RelA/SpoT-type nucleotidyltranferase
MGLSEQDHLVSQIAGLFPGAKKVDRRKRPSHGYRAVHLIVSVERRVVEIQVRTAMQDLWAQAMERLADKVGR